MSVRYLFLHLIESQCYAAAGVSVAAVVRRPLSLKEEYSGA
jgi:hypothetical protein